jgi:hypothetical protein
MAQQDLSRPYELVLDLDTALGNPIANVQTTELIPVGMASGFSERYRRQFPGIQERTSNPTASYNCHGMVFAARRTSIIEASEVRKILREDGYREIEVRQALPGDVALYVIDGAIEHSAFVVEPPSTLSIPRVVSKWGNWVEVVHWANQCPWAMEPDAILEYHRLVR